MSVETAVILDRAAATWPTVPGALVCPGCGYEAHEPCPEGVCDCCDAIDAALREAATRERSAR